MDVKKFQLAMRPKKYLTHDFLVYLDPSMQAARSEMQGFKEGGRVGFKNGGFAEKLENAIFEINKRNELGILSRAEDIAKASGIDKSDINKYIRDGRLPKLITKEEAVKKYINNALDINKPLSAFKNQSILDYLNNTLPEGSKGRLGISDIKKYVKSNYPELYTKLYAKQTGAMDFINKNEKIQNLGVNDYLRDPELIRNQTYIENLSLGAKRDELRILNAKLKLGAKDFAISQAQDRLVDDLNKAIRNDPSIVLDNPKLMELASARVNSKTGELMIGVRDENKIKADIDKGFFSKEHLNPKAGEKINVEFPTNKILVPRTTNESFIRSVQSYTKNNPEATLSDDLLNFINHHGFNIKTEAGQILGPKIGSTIENGKLGSFARQLEAYGVDTSKFNLSVPDVTKTELTQLKQPIKIRAQELKKSIDPKTIQSQFGDVLDSETNKLLTELSNTVSMNPAASKALLLSTLQDLSKVGTKAARFAGAVLIGATRGEILTTLGLEAAMPFMSYLRGEGGKRMLSESFLADFVAQGLNKAGVIDYDIDELNKSIYASGLKGIELDAATNTVNQYQRLETMASLLRESERLTNEIKNFEEEKSSLPAYKHSALDQRIKIRQQRIDEINNEIPSLVEKFADPKNKVTKVGVNALQKSIEQFSEEEAYKGYRRKKPILDFFENIGVPLVDPSKTLPTTAVAEQTQRNIGNVFGVPETPVGQEVVESVGSGAQRRLDLQEKLPRETLGIEDIYGGSMYAEGGAVVQRKGFANGPKIGRRGFLGMLAAVIASLKVGSFGSTGKKVTSEVAKKVIKDAPTGTPDWFAPLVDKVFREGVDAGETMKTVTGRETVKKLEVPTEGAEGALMDRYYLYENPDTGEIRVEIDIPGAGANDGEFALYMRPNKIDGINDDGTPMIDEGEFFISEDRAVGGMNGPDDYYMELLSTDVGLEDSASDWYRVEKFATGKTNEAARQKKLKYKQDIEADPTQDIIDRQGEYDYSSYKDLDIDE